MLEKKLCKSSHNKKLDGVCAGIGNYFNVDPTLIRVVWAVFTIFSAFFGGLIAYVLCALIMPSESSTGNNSFPEDDFNKQ